MDKDDNVLDMSHLIRYADDGSSEEQNTEHLMKWETYSSTKSALELLQEIRPLDGKARRRIRRAQERKNKKK